MIHKKQSGHSKDGCLLTERLQVFQIGFLCSSSLVLESWRISRELLVFSLHKNPEKVAFNTSCSNRMDELANKSDGKRQKAKVSFIYVLYIGCHQKVRPRFRVDLSAARNLIKEIFPSCS